MCSLVWKRKRLFIDGCLQLHYGIATRADRCGWRALCQRFAVSAQERQALFWLNLKYRTLSKVQPVFLFLKRCKYAVTEVARSVTMQMLNICINVNFENLPKRKRLLRAWISIRRGRVIAISEEAEKPRNILWRFSSDMRANNCAELRRRLFTPGSHWYIVPPIRAALNPTDYLFFSIIIF